MISMNALQPRFATLEAPRRGTDAQVSAETTPVVQDTLEQGTQASPTLLDSARKRLDQLFVPGKYDRIDVHLTDKEYQNIGNVDAARMIGYFTQGLLTQGFPWQVFNCQIDGEQVTKTTRLSEMEALSKLQKGEPVLFQPLRNLQLDLSSNSLGALAAAGQIGGRADLSEFKQVADFSKNTQVTPGSQGIQLKYGAPTVVSSLGQLKLLHEMYNPEVKINENNAVSKAAHQFSYFTKETMASPYPWRFYRVDEGNRALRVLKAAVPGAFGGSAVGAALGLLVGLPVGLFAGNWSILKTLVSYGAVAGGVYKGLDSARVATKGVGVNAVEGLERVLEGKPVVLQQTQMRSVGVPILGKISWFSDYGKGSTIASSSDLDTFYFMQNQAAKLPSEKEEKKKEEPKQPIVIVNEVTVLNEQHNHATPPSVIVVDSH